MQAFELGNFSKTKISRIVSNRLTRLLAKYSGDIPDAGKRELYEYAITALFILESISQPLMTEKHSQAHKSPREKQKFVVSARTSGLGDMMNQLTHAMWYARNSGRRVLVDWLGSRYYTERSATERFDIFERFFECDDISSSPSDLALGQGAAVEPSPTELSAAETEEVEAPFIELFSILGRDIPLEIVRLTRPVDFLPLDVLAPFYNKLRVRDRVTAPVQATLSQLSTAIGVHIRHGNGELYNEEDELVLFERYREAIVRCKELNPNSSLFLATDSKLVEDWFEGEFGNHLKLPKYLPEEKGHALHHPDSTSKATVSRLDVFEGALRDMVALGQCKILVCDTWSSYTRASQAWGGANKKNGRLFPIKVPRKSWEQLQELKRIRN
ncbi:nodulation protein NodZ [Hoeflea sp. CAU 1731]